MDLRNNQITVAQLLDNPQARALLDREFPGLSNQPLVRSARGLTLAQVLHLVAGRVSPRKIQYLLEELKKL